MNQDSEIIHSLRSPSLATRLAALHQISSLNSGEDLRHTLKEILVQEKDVECRFLLQHLVGELEIPNLPIETSKPAPKQQNPSVVPEDFFQAWETADAREKLKLLNSLSPKSRTFLGPQATILLKRTSHPVIEATLIRTFASTWPEEELVILTPRLTSKSFAVRTAALEVLIERSPQSILTSLPRFLASEDPGLRVMAVRALMKIDPEEAVGHLEAMLLEGDLIQRMLALQSAVFFPFAAIRGLLLKFLALEKELGLIRKATLLFRMNPDLESPFRLWEIAEEAGPEKASLLREAVKGAGQAIRDSGMLTDGLDQYMYKLKDWILKRRALRYVQDCVNHLAEGTVETFVQLKPIILKNFHEPYAIPAFRTALRWPISDDIRNFIAGLIHDHESLLTNSDSPQSKPESVPEPLPEPPSSTSPIKAVPVSLPSTNTKTEPVTPLAKNFPPLESLSPDQQLQQIGGWEPERASDVLPLLRRILENRKTPPLHWVAALRLAMRFKLKDFGDCAEKALRDSDPGKVAISLEFLAWAHPEAVTPLIGRYLKGQHPRVKSAALKIMKQDDPQRAISALMLMLKSTSFQERQAASNCLIYFDFDLLRDRLCQLIEQGLTPDLIQPSLCLFVSNPDTANLYPLYRLEQLVPNDQKDIFRKVRRQCGEILIEFGQLAPGDKRAQEGELKQLWEKEQTRRTKPTPAYALKTIQAQNQLSRMSSGSFVRGLIQEIPDWFKVVFPTLAILVIIFHVGFTHTPAGSTERIKPQALLAAPLKTALTVCEINKSAGFLRLKDFKGLVYQLPTKELPHPLPLPGKTCQLTLVPLYVGSDGIIYSRFMELSHSPEILPTKPSSETIQLKISP
ncbi:MAG: HEAT repeat domain-containing protein [Candidatus Ozemobacteraceae bacterium]